MKQGDNLYQVRDAEKLEPHYSEHIDRMTVEHLINKRDIAGELAVRDLEIEKLKDIWEAASDFLLAESDIGFAIEHGGVAHLKKVLKSAISDYEDIDTSIEEGGR